MKTIATEAPTSHISARCKASTRGAVCDEGKPSAVAAYAIARSDTYATKLVTGRPPKIAAVHFCRALEYFPERWTPAFRKKMRPIKD
ncbi:MAG TPA: hypothetical protein VII41_03635, partial [Steroidobacteraceae bacterium]